jgi:hypothetical protein
VNIISLIEKLAEIHTLNNGNNSVTLPSKLSSFVVITMV